MTISNEQLEGEEAAKKAELAIKEFLESCNLAIENLSIDFIAKDAKVIAKGEAESIEVIDKATELITSIQGVLGLENLISLKSSNLTKDEVFHNVQAGETLEDISKIYFGSEDKAEDIYQANAENIAEDKKLYSGLKLKIPTKS